MVYKFGVFEFDSDMGELRKNGRAVALEPQPAQALALLVARPGEVVTREELRDAVWGADTHVDFDRGPDSSPGHNRRRNIRNLKAVAEGVKADYVREHVLKAEG